jgi:uncharacterized protein YchJ
LTINTVAGSFILAKKYLQPLKRSRYTAYALRNGVIKSIGKVGLQTNQGKNALCSCGSGKKFKRCCGAG